MTKTDRLLAIVLELQGKKRQRAEDLARTFETSKRTIYRDIQALCEAGVPLISTPGQGYSLMEGYFLPPLSFSTEEATMLLLGSEFMAHNFDAQYRQAALSAQRKIESVLPEHLRTEVQYIQNSIHFVAQEMMSNQVENEKLQQVRRALIERKLVRFRYHARHRQTESLDREQRTVSPYGLAHVQNSWYLVGYCHTRKDKRNFRLERIDQLVVLEETFERPAQFRLQQDRTWLERAIVVRALFAPEVARWVHEARSYYVVSEEEDAEGLLVTLAARQEDEVLQWLLSWGSQVRVLEPESLRQKLCNEAERMMTIYKGTDKS